MSSQPDINPPIINFATDTVGLGPMRRDLIPTYQRWINDVEVARFVGFFLPMTDEEEERWYDAIVREENSVHFTIYEMADRQPIGTIGLHDINHRHGRAELGVAIGDAAQHGKGYGTEAVRLICDYGFNGIGLTNIMLRLIAFNERALRAYAKAGFREFGRRRRSDLVAGQRFDEIYMDLLADEFESPVLAQRLTAPPRR